MHVNNYKRKRAEKDYLKQASNSLNKILTCLLMINKLQMKFKDKSIFKNKNKRLKKYKDRMRRIMMKRWDRKSRWRRLIIIIKMKSKMCE